MEIRIEAKRGCSLSSILFNLREENLKKEELSDVDFKIKGRIINTVGFADHTCLVDKI